MPQAGESSVAIVGSGIAGSALAYELTARGIDTLVFEKGPPVPYPHHPQFTEEILYRYQNPAYHADPDIQNSVVTGDYRPNLERERGMVVGGSGTHWLGITLRMIPEDFQTRTRFGYGTDWPFGYPDLEPFYGRAERHLGTSGTDADNPYAPPRSTPYPLPPFELAYHDRILAARLAEHGMSLHTTPQARTRQPYDARPACANYGACHVCPIGARYSPNLHLERAVATGLCRVIPDTTVRRIIPGTGSSRGVVVVQGADDSGPTEHAARLIVIAAGAIETARLLLLSRGGAFPDGVGNQGGQVGRHFTFHHAWRHEVRFPERLYPGRFGGWTGQSHQFLNPPGRGDHAAVKIEFSSNPVSGPPTRPGTAEQTRAGLESRLHRRGILFVGESTGSDEKRVGLSDRVDRFGDPFAHIQYRSNDLDLRTHAFVRDLNDRFVAALGLEPQPLDPEPARYTSAAHHMGGGRMSRGPDTGVADEWGRVHGAPDVLLAGSSLFPQSSGAVNPTLTLLAMALRSVDVMVERLRTVR